MCPHGNGTHTECVGHALPGTVTLADISLKQKFFPAFLLSVEPEDWRADSDTYPAGAVGDKCITQAALDAALQQAGGTVPADVQAIVLRTPASSDDAARKHWGGSNPPYLTAHAMAWLRGHGAQHIVVDLPSVDKEDDGGYLVAHRTFWGIAKRGSRLVAAAGGGDPASDDSCPTWTAAQESKHGIPLATQADDDSDVWDSPAGSAMARHIVCRTITELAMVPPDLHDGEYMLVLAVAPIHMDAAPSDPLLVPYMK